MFDSMLFFDVICLTDEVEFFLEGIKIGLSCKFESLTDDSNRLLLKSVFEIHDDFIKNILVIFSELFLPVLLLDINFKSETHGNYCSIIF